MEVLNQKTGLHYDIHSFTVWHSFEDQSANLRIWHWNKTWSWKSDPENRAPLWHPFEDQSVDLRCLHLVKTLLRVESSIQKVALHYGIYLKQTLGFLFEIKLAIKIRSKNEPSLWHPFEVQSVSLRICNQSELELESVVQKIGFTVKFINLISRSICGPTFWYWTSPGAESSIYKIMLHYDVNLKVNRSSLSFFFEIWIFVSNPHLPFEIGFWKSIAKKTDSLYRDQHKGTTL